MQLFLFKTQQTFFDLTNILYKVLGSRIKMFFKPSAFIPFLKLNNCFKNLVFIELRFTDIINNLTTNNNESIRPSLEDNCDVIINEKWRELMIKCWHENPSKRPTFTEISFKSKEITKQTILMLKICFYFTLIDVL